MAVHFCNTHEDFWNQVQKEIIQTDSVLDIGPGIRPQKLISPVVHICCEPYVEYANSILQKKWRTKEMIVLNVDWKEALEIFPNSSIDTIITMDVIEHLEKDEGVALLAQTVAKARRQVAIFTPYGFLPQEVPNGMKDAWGLSGTEWQKHRSGWLPEDFGNEWEIFVCENFHFNDAITGEKFEKPYGAMFAILKKNSKNSGNIYSLIRGMLSFSTISLPLYIKSNSIIYNPIIKGLYRKILKYFK